MTFVYQIKALCLKLKSRFTFILVKTCDQLQYYSRQTRVFIMYYGDTSVKPCIVIDLDQNISFIKVEP